MPAQLGGGGAVNRLSAFNSPLLLGFDHFEQLLDRVAKSANDGYPPYNIERVATDGLRITLAVAGFAREDLEIAAEDNQLIVRGRQHDDEKPFMSTAALRRGSFNAALSWLKGSKSRAPAWTMECCILIWCGRGPKPSHASLISLPARRPPTEGCLSPPGPRRDNLSTCTKTAYAPCPTKGSPYWARTN
jgi:hypothetical protein